MKTIYYDDVRFTRDDTTGYYLNSTIRKRLHRYIWEKEVGEIPEGKHIHHINHDKSDNRVENLEMLNASEHASHHGTIMAMTEYDRLVHNLEVNARPKANEWHGSKEGIEWHKEHYQNYKDKLHEKIDLACKQCGVEYRSVKISKFCSNNCKSKYRRESGVDNEVRICAHCKEEYTVNKYQRNVCCGRSCSNSYRARKPKQ